MFKFRDNDGNWRELKQRVEEDILKVAVRYNVQEDEAERRSLRVKREKESFEWTVA